MEEERTGGKDADAKEESISVERKRWKQQRAKKGDQPVPLVHSRDVTFITGHYGGIAWVKISITHNSKGLL